MKSIKSGKHSILIGFIKRFLAHGMESEGVFSHASAFNSVAHAPRPTGKEPESYLMEPYVFSQSCVGASDPENHGRGSFHGLTGTASRMFRAITNRIFGVCAVEGGLRVDPSVDPSWERFSMTRGFRGAIFQFHFENPMGVQHGVQEVYLYGMLPPDNLVPLKKTGSHEVRVQLGSAQSL